MGACIVRTAGGDKIYLKESGASQVAARVTDDDNDDDDEDEANPLGLLSETQRQYISYLPVRTLVLPRGRTVLGGAKVDTYKKTKPRFKHASQSIP
jgi:hypothetical protein